MAANALPSSQPHYTCLIRLPFARGDFEDPPPVDWDMNKDKALWRIISKAANSKDLDWPELSASFQVSLSFLLQQAAWLYERHFAQMRAQMKKLGASGPPMPSLSGDATSQSPASAASPKVTGQGFRMQSSLATATRDSPSMVASTMSPPSRANAPPMSRTPSSRTITQSRLNVSASPRSKTFRSSFGTSHRRQPTLDDIEADSTSPQLGSSSASLSSSSSSRRPHPAIAKSRILSIPLDLRTISSDGDGEAEDDDSSGGLLPFASRDEPPSPDRTGARHVNRDNESATQSPRALDSRGARFRDPRSLIAAQTAHPASSSTIHMSRPAIEPARTASDTARHTTGKTNTAQAMSRTQSSPMEVERGRATGAAQARDSTFSRAAVAGPSARTGLEQPPGALSPRQLGRLGGRGSTQGSDGTPSMGSSFSDLDDASVTQSALEDALLSKMHAPDALTTFGSRMSNFSQALRSKYLPQQQ